MTTDSHPARDPCRFQLTLHYQYYLPKTIRDEAWARCNLTYLDLGRKECRVCRLLEVLGDRTVIFVRLGPNFLIRAHIHDIGLPFFESRTVLSPER